MFGSLGKRDQLVPLPNPTSPARVMKPAELLAHFTGQHLGPGQVEEQAVSAEHSIQRGNYEELHRLEKRFAAHRTSWIEGARVLAEIHRRRLYRDRSSSFEQYLSERWNLSRRQGLDYVTAAAVADNVQEVRHSLSLCAALKLARLPADQQAACLQGAIAGCGSRSPTADYLAAAVAARLPARSSKNAKRRGKNRRPKLVRLRLASGILTILPKKNADLRALLVEALEQLDLNRNHTTPGGKQCAA